MRILFTIPHFYRVRRGSPHGSHGPDATARARALSTCVSALHRVLGGQQHVANLIALFANSTAPAEPLPAPIGGTANDATTNQLNVTVATTGSDHVLDRVPFLQGAISHQPRCCDPRLLGFECHALLGQFLGKYDYYCYMEDDLVIHDPWFFIKLRHFSDQHGDEALLQPNRFEFAENALASKVYIDGEVPSSLTGGFQDMGDRPEALLSVAGTSVPCVRRSNPHSGSFFLNSRQMERWCKQACFLDRDSSFIGPLESAATLGIMRTFRVYKPAAPVANFLEIQHLGDGWIRRLAALQRRLGARAGSTIADEPPVDKG